MKKWILFAILMMTTLDQLCAEKAKIEGFDVYKKRKTKSEISRPKPN